MDVPAWAFSNLCIGRTYDANNNRAGIDIFLRDIPTKTENVNTFSFRYKIVKTNEDVRDLLNISGNISLKIKANILKVEGAGKYINFRGKDEGITEVLAVMKCSTVSCVIKNKNNPNCFYCIFYCLLSFNFFSCSLNITSFTFRYIQQWMDQQSQKRMCCIFLTWVPTM